MSKLSYATSGVSTTKDDVHAAIARYDAGLFPGAFCKIVDDAQRDPDYCTVMHADGAGTKSTLAYIHYKESGDASVFKGIAQDSIVMNLDDMLCVGATDAFVVSNTIGRNAHRIDGDVVRAIIDGYEDFAASMEAFGIRILLAGGETADLGDLVPTVIVDSTIFARLPRADVIDCDRIQAGDVIVGLASGGQATYETSENSGIASNGFTAARHMLLSSHYAKQYPETYSTTLDQSVVYSGDFRMSDPLPGSGLTVGGALLSPTRTYLPVMKAVYGEFRKNIRGVIQASGGGQVKCRAFGHGLHYVKDNLFERPAIFSALANTGALAASELYEVFNMGHRLEIFTDQRSAEGIIKIANDFSIGAQIVGHVESSPDGLNRVTIRDGGQDFAF